MKKRTKKRKEISLFSRISHINFHPSCFAQVELLSRLHHCHVVPLLGYCLEFQGKHSEGLLVFEYMANGNLRDCLDGTLGENMNWETRVTIAIGAARGLEYLHEAAAPRILHRDVKSTNILLDENWRAKVRIYYFGYALQILIPNRKMKIILTTKLVLPT